MFLSSSGTCALFYIFSVNVGYFQGLDGYHKISYGQQRCKFFHINFVTVRNDHIFYEYCICEMILIKNNVKRKNELTVQYN